MIAPRLLLLLGSFLVSLPIFAELFRAWQFADLAKAVLAAQGSFTAPEPPVIWYAVVATTGTVLILLAGFMGIKKAPVTQ